MRSDRPTRLLLVSLAILAVSLGGCDTDSLLSRLTGKAAARSGRRDTQVQVNNSTDLMVNLSHLYPLLEIDSTSVRSQMFMEERTREVFLELPRGRPLEEAVWLFTDAARRTPYTVSDCSRGSGATAFTIQYSSRREDQERVRVTCKWSQRFHSRSGTVAFLVRDFGFEPTQTINDLLSFPDPLTVALPGHEDKSNWTARVADHYRKEIVVLVPMENKTGASPGPQPIQVHHTEEQMTGALTTAARNIPNFAGFCNQGGSRILEDSRATRAILSHIERLHGYFLEEDPSPQSLAVAAAEEFRLPYRRFDARIGDKASGAEADEFMQGLVNRAHKSASVLVSVPATAAVAGALSRNRELFAKSGVRLVYVSDILIHPGE
jgi:polysaccharide deacetylase 2 family uncharacterized protein YibQ